MNIFEAMDQLLASTAESGHEPLRWQMRSDDWGEILHRRNSNTLADVDPSAGAPKAYKGIEIEFVELREQAIVGLVYRGGRAEIEAD